MDERAFDLENKAYDKLKEDYLKLCQAVNAFRRSHNQYMKGTFLPKKVRLREKMEMTTGDHEEFGRVDGQIMTIQHILERIRI